MTPSVAVVILNYNGEQLLPKFLLGVLNSNYENLQVIVADNASTDNSRPYLKTIAHPSFSTILLPKNYGFAEGYNQALKSVEADYYVLLNSDVEVTANWLNPMIELLEASPEIAACQPKIKQQSNKEFFEFAGAAGGYMDALGYPFARGRIFEHLEKDEGQYEESQPIFWASGAAICIRSSAYHNFGGFYGALFAHMEEIDLCWRLQRAGYTIQYCPQAEVYHVGGGTLGADNPFKAYLNFRNSLTVLVRNETFSTLYWKIPARLILDGVAGAQFLLKGKFKTVWAIVRAHWSFFTSFPRILKDKREANQLIKQHAIKPSSTIKGILKGSIVWAYYAQGKKTFHELPNRKLL